jgi:hypothetical protein
LATQDPSDVSGPGEIQINMGHFVQRIISDVNAERDEKNLEAV